MGLSVCAVLRLDREAMCTTWKEMGLTPPPCTTLCTRSQEVPSEESSSENAQEGSPEHALEKLLPEKNIAPPPFNQMESMPTPLRKRLNVPAPTHVGKSNVEEVMRQLMEQNKALQAQLDDERILHNHNIESLLQAMHEREEGK